ncbi:CPBP family intramembrane metalloprotease [Halorussus gelatinilyticus]|uniref:CPBP family intramembrane metalloprotease n=1 Tax=Halorussus gelatinilyticus TaxID=2937524 RepID=A0A8U0IG96_9EURY|nr:CPBP family intramembrane glutamic endopeptidase [Halorussus gelatinilyticus]UPV99720.1 CPBP family intramembrane metalloprotease [Halorussus gelatinilyticus]
METNVDESVGRSRQNGSVLGRTLRVFGLALVGVVGLGISLFFGDALPPLPGVSPGVAVVLSLVTPTILLLVASAVGAFCAPRVGLRSRVAARAPTARAADANATEVGTSENAGTSEGVRASGETTATRGFAAEARHAIPWGLLAGGLLVGLDLAFAAVTDLSVTAEAPTVGAVVASLPMRFLYGGIAEEVLLRWGFMAAVAWVVARVAGQGRSPSRGVMWASIAVSAVVFGVGHLPALAQTVGLTPLLVARTVLLNTVGGVIFGWLFWRDSLEAAMVGHASAHVPLALFALFAAL